MNSSIRSFQIKVALLFFVVYSIWWIVLQFTNITNNPTFDLFASTYCLLAIWGAVWGINYSRKWGGFKSILGKSILFFSFGLLAQAFGQISYSYYILVLKVDIPYPSVGDIGYFGTIPMYALGAFHLAQVSGIKFSLRSFRNQIAAIILPAFLLFATYIVFFKDYQFESTDFLTIFLDFAYPLGDAIYISIAMLTYLLSRKIIGGVMKNKILIILFALFLQYLADFKFLYDALTDAYVGGGITDYMYLVSYFVMTVAILQFNRITQE